MTKQALPILLILLMLITPIVSAFEHCSGMDMSAPVSENKNFSVTLLANDAGLLNHQTILKGERNNQVDMDCQTVRDCSFHSCAALGITSSAQTVTIVKSPLYSNFEYTPPNSTAFSPNLRPPILIL